MTHALDSERRENRPAQAEEKGGNLHVYLIVLGALAFAALIAYQFLFCSACY